MKKVLILIAVLLLTACSAKNISWQDVQADYDSLSKEAIAAAEENADFLTADYQALLNDILSGVNNLEAGVKQEEQDTARSLYANAAKLEALVASFNNEEASRLNDLAGKLKELVKAAYEKSSDFKDAKNSLISLTQEILEDDLSGVQKKKKILWAEVKDEYEQLVQTTIENLPAPKEVSEAQLELYKNVILSNYEDLSNGVNQDNKEAADMIYEAATALHEYTYRLNSVEADKVNRFAIGACQYVEECYGEKIDDPDYDFLTTVTEARKWTLSLWNELVKLLNM
ncbi:MAG: hypothetical protein IJI46_01460 [Erysipelotrichaceae bacterium]|nr:hypothetical protein [Erysipelotrichaceae bacterium]